MAKLIMTVDDSTSVRQMVSFTLKQSGYDVIEAKDGQDALEKLENAQVDMIIADLHMPRIDGIELIKNVRQQDRFRYVPIIMLTTESMVKKKMEGKTAGATGWIVKPFKPEQLIAVVQKVLR